MTENEIFKEIDYTKNMLARDEYEKCAFVNCNFNNADLSSVIFRDCEFDNCDFSLAKMKGTELNNIKFSNCKLLGVHFDDCNDFLLSVSFKNCLLKLSTFYKLKLKMTKFDNCNLQETDFSETDLTGSVFTNCDLQKAMFDRTNLEKVDFRSAFSYSIDPEKNRIKKAKFSRMDIAGLLDKYDIEIE
ncbi:MAG: pentapeptide repeat-containing protein [Candidatus Marinimicrobia bacterium]|nr:pentapeptide repeat-containing protein [Candidatus Neomarinimicrobiota bacterium]